jgi:hypothetical protein
MPGSAKEPAPHFLKDCAMNRRPTFTDSYRLRLARDSDAAPAYKGVRRR